MTSTKYERALAAIDAAHALDPNKIVVKGVDIPYELHYATKMSSYLSLLRPQASETLRLAIRSQHFRRWEVPRSSYPATKAGYFAWRTYLKKRQAEQAKAILLERGYNEEDAERVAVLIRKEDIKTDDESQVLEDVACLVFLDDQFEAFEKEHDEKKIVDILRKTWRKMSEEGHELALKIPMSARSQELVKMALEEQK